MAETPEYTFLTTDLLTGAIIDEVELSSFNYTDIFNRPGAGSATVRIDHSKTTPTNFNSWRNALWFLRRGDVIWGGIMGSISPVQGTRVLTVPLYGFMEYPRWRFLRDTQGMLNTNGDSTVIRWEGVDKYLVARDMILHINSFVNGDIGLDVIWDTLSGDAVTRTYHDYQYKYAGVAFEDLADSSLGFDWAYQFSVDTGLNQPRVRVALREDNSRDTSYLLEFDNDPGESNMIGFDPDAADRPVNGVGALGEGDGDALIHTYLSETTEFPLFEDTISHKDVTQLPTLTGHAERFLEHNKIPRSNLKATIDPNKEPNPFEVAVGDRIPARIDDNWMQYNLTYRVYQKQIILTETHDVQCKLGLEFVG